MKISWKEKAPTLITNLVPILFCVFFHAYPAWGLEPQPRTWNHLPIDMNFAGGGYAHTKADIYVDPALRLENVEMEADTWAVKYIRTFAFLGKSGRMDITQAHQKIDWTGLLDGKQASTSREGMSDTFVRFAFNILGAPPLAGKEFVTYRRRTKRETIVGLGLALRLPTGHYEKDRLLNIGRNMYVVRPQVGLLRRIGKWSFEWTVETSFYSKNDEFFGGNTLEQDPLFITHAHLIHAFRPGYWTSVSLGYDYGARSTVNGIKKNDTKEDVAWAVSIGVPLKRAIGLKINYIGTSTRRDTGFDSDTLAASVSFMW